MALMKTTKKNAIALVLLLVLGVIMTTSGRHGSTVHGRIMVGGDEKDEEEDAVVDVVVDPDNTIDEYDVASSSSFIIRENTSVLDYLDPSILEDPSIITEIQDNFRKGNLVVIKDAFLPEFAEYVYQDMSNETNTWLPFVSIKSNGHNFFKHKMKQKTDVMKQVREIFKHEKSREFFTMLSGRNCMNEKEFSAL